jgi:hypothetical protein
MGDLTIVAIAGNTVRCDFAVWMQPVPGDSDSTRDSPVLNGASIRSVSACDDWGRGAARSDLRVPYPRRPLKKLGHFPGRP